MNKNAQQPPKVTKKGFTLIELIVVLAVIGILALLAMPKFLSKTEQAKLTQIQHDIRVVEGKLNLALMDNPDTLKAWEPAEATELTELASDNKLIGRGGPTLGPPTGDVWVIDDEFLNAEVRTKLNGDFLVDTDGNVFYEHSKPVVPGKPEMTPGKEETPLTYEEWLAKVQAEGYVLATDEDFSGETDGKFKYIGSDKLVIVPNVIKGVDVTSYESMFEKTYVEGVASYNPNITDMSFMFFGSQATTLASQPTSPLP